jgi:hypothetical protein
MNANSSKTLFTSNMDDAAELLAQTAFAYIVVIKRNGQDGPRFPLVDDQCYVGRSVNFPCFFFKIRFGADLLFMLGSERPTAIFACKFLLSASVTAAWRSMKI